MLFGGRGAGDRFLRRLVVSPFYVGQIVHCHETEARAARLEPIPGELAEAARELLVGSGVTSLYSHQAAAVRELLRGGHVMLSTPTASGAAGPGYKVYNIKYTI